MLGPKFSLYGQLDGDLGFYRNNSLVSTDGARRPYFPTGALSVGARYYYNQAGRARQNRAHGAFNGNYLALEAHTEARRYYEFDASGQRFTPGYAPSLNIVWGMQRRLGHNFLFDLNAGAGVGYTSGHDYYGSRASLNTQLNLGIYFGH